MFKKVLLSKLMDRARQIALDCKKPELAVLVRLANAHTGLGVEIVDDIGSRRQEAPAPTAA